MKIRTGPSASTTCLPAAALIAGNAIGVLPTNFLTTWSIHIAVIIFIALLSVGLADKLTALKDELMASNSNISLMLQSISQDADNHSANIKDCREEEIGQLLQTGFQGFTQKFKELVGAVRDNADNLNESSSGLFSLSDRMTAETGEMSARAGSVASVSEQMSANMTTIASSIEEQFVSTREIASNVTQISQGVSETNKSVAQCSDVATAVSRDVTALSGSSRQMNDNSLAIRESAAELSRIADGLADLMKKFQV